MGIVQWMSDYQFTCALSPTLEKCEMLAELLVLSYDLDQDNAWKVTTSKMVATTLKSVICHLRQADVMQ